MKAINLSHRGFRKMVIRIFKELSENSNSMKKDIQTIKNNIRNEEYNI